MPELVSCIPDRPDAHVADLDAVNKPENDEPSIVEPIESFAARHPLHRLPVASRLVNFTTTNNNNSYWSEQSTK